MNSTEWAHVFRSTLKLSSLRTQIDSLNALNSRTPEEENRLSSAIEAVSDIVIQFYSEQASYLVSWAASERCQFSTDTQPTLTCNPLPDIVTGGNPLNGGMPKPLTPVRIGREKRDQLNMAMMTLGMNQPEYGNFTMLLKLRRETSDIYQGDVILSEESKVIQEGKVVPTYRYGYVEVRLD
jgi:hypothetical protein